MLESAAPRPDRRDLRLTGIVAALAVMLFLSKAAIAWQDNHLVVPLDNVPLEALAGSLRGCGVLAALVLIGWTAPRRATAWVLAPLAVAYALMLFVNIGSR